MHGESSAENWQAMMRQVRLKQSIKNQINRWRKAERERANVLAQTIYLGTLGLVMVLPIVAGAYLGLWLDEMMAGYSIRWTLSLLLLGVVIGFFNVYFLVKD
jgi:ATP synthase protein I